MSQQITNTNENIENILLGVAEQNNEVRVQAEKALTDLEANRDNYILSLLSMVRISSHSSVRLVASVLLRQKLTQNEDPFWYLITDETKYQLTGNLLQILNNEKVLIIKEKICDIISEIASMIFEAGDWPELMPSLHSLCQSPEPYNRICGLRIFKNLSPYIAEYRREELPRLRVCLNSSSNSFFRHFISCFCSKKTVPLSKSKPAKQRPRSSPISILLIWGTFCACYRSSCVR